MSDTTFSKETRGVSAPNSGIDTADFDRENVAGSRCEHCGHVGHEHDKERVYTENGYHYKYRCPE